MGNYVRPVVDARPDARRLPAPRSRPHRDAPRLRARGLRIVHGARRRCVGAVLSDARRAGGRKRRSRRSRALPCDGELNPLQQAMGDSHGFPVRFLYPGLHDDGHGAAAGEPSRHRRLRCARRFPATSVAAPATRASLTAFCALRSWLMSSVGAARFVGQSVARIKDARILTGSRALHGRHRPARDARGRVRPRRPRARPDRVDRRQRARGRCRV